MTRKGYVFKNVLVMMYFYILIPSTAKPDQGQYLVRFDAEKEASIEELEQMVEHDPQELMQLDSGENGIKLNFKSNQEIYDYFDGVADPTGEIGWEELQTLLDFALDPSVRTYEGGIITEMIHWIPGSSLVIGKPSLKPTFTKDECRNIIQQMDIDLSGRLSYKEFEVLWKKMQLWETVFLEHSEDHGPKIIGKLPKKLGQALTEVGYHVKPSEMHSLVDKYSDYGHTMEFDDFVMCVLSLISKPIQEKNMA